MNTAKALKIIHALANGRHPLDHAPLPDESVLRNPNVVRALFMAAKSLLREMNMLPGAYGPWSSDEEARLVASFDQGFSQADIAREHKRSRGGIQARLRKLGKIAKVSAVPAKSQKPPRTRGAVNRKPDDGAEINMLPGAGAPWSPAEEARLEASFKKGIAPAEIAKEHKRTLGAIHSRLEKLGLIVVADGVPYTSQMLSLARVADSRTPDDKPDDDIPF